MSKSNLKRISNVHRTKRIIFVLRVTKILTLIFFLLTNLSSEYQTKMSGIHSSWKMF